MIQKALLGQLKAKQDKVHFGNVVIEILTFKIGCSKN